MVRYSWSAIICADVVLWLPILSLAPEMLGSFYTQWVLPWLPMRMLYDGIKKYAIL